MRPIATKGYGPIELKLGIKSSLPKVKTAVALLIALWKSCGQKSEIFYTQLKSGAIEINDDILNSLKNYFQPIIVDETTFRKTLNENPLLASQIESLKVTFELIWRIGIFQFEDKNKTYSAERTGGVRYPKKILFTKNMDVINLVIKHNEDAYKQILYSWITEKTLEKQYLNNEDDLINVLTLISEEAVYRLRLDENNDLKFMNQGIYLNFSNGDEQVDATDYKENMGGLRILQNLVSENLNSYLKKQDNLFVLKDLTMTEFLKDYTKRVENFLSLTTISIDEIPKEKAELEYDENKQTTKIKHPHNRIIFGAPGTGKSYILEQQRALFDSNYARVTFHPNYSYAQFVGTYKPKPKINTDGSEFISYEFIPGPFLRMWVQAIKKPDQNYLLIVEEINRANVAAVFGDIFQLLDRKADGTSEYLIGISDDLKDYLVKECMFEETNIKEIGIPNNLYIWATMNSADQGVFPMDAAFKRRWNFEYISIDQGSGQIAEMIINLKPYGEIKWNFIRDRINQELTGTDLNVNEDKLIGPFFLNDKELSSDNIDDIFKSKLLMYLFEDVLKHRKGKLFKSTYNTFSKIVAAYDKGENIFNFELNPNSNYPDAGDESINTFASVAEPNATE